MMENSAPIELTGYDEEKDVILAQRAGEPSFIWVQDIGDAYQAAGTRGGVDIVVTRAVWDQLLAEGYVEPRDSQLLRIV